LIVRIPPERYGGTERVVQALTEALVERGHDVTLFAAGGTRTSAIAARHDACSALGDGYQRPARIPSAAGRRAGRPIGGVRPHPLSRRLPALDCRRTSAGARDHDHAQPARPARAPAAVLAHDAMAPGLHLGCPAAPGVGPGSELACDGPQWPRLGLYV